MSDYISREAASADERKHKIKTPFAKIIVGGTPENPCYNILYFDLADGKCHIGFGSYCLDNVFNWLAEEFEITEPCADVEPVRHGRWVGRSGLFQGECSVCGYRTYDKTADWARKYWTYCPNCGTKMYSEGTNDD